MKKGCLIVSGIALILVIGIAIILNSLLAQVDQYPKFSDGKPIGRITVTHKNVKTADIDFIFLDGTKKELHLHLFPCNWWRLEANIITPTPNTSGFISTSVYSRLQVIGETCYDKLGNLDNAYPPLLLASGSDNVYENMQNCQFMCLFEAKTVISQPEIADGRAYDIYITSNGIQLIPAHS